jgi:hypothetical protein
MVCRGATGEAGHVVDDRVRALAGVEQPGQDGDRLVEEDLHRFAGVLGPCGVGVGEQRGVGDDVGPPSA